MVVPFDRLRSVMSVLTAFASADVKPTDAGTSTVGSKVHAAHLETMPSLAPSSASHLAMAAAAIPLSLVGDGIVKPVARVHCSICPTRLRVGAPAITPSNSVPYLAAALSAPRPPLEHPSKYVKWGSWP